MRGEDAEEPESERPIDVPDTEAQLRRKLEAIARANGPLPSRPNRRPATGLIFAAAAIGFFIVFGAVLSKRFEGSNPEASCLDAGDPAACGALCEAGHAKACEVPVGSSGTRPVPSGPSTR